MTDANLVVIVLAAGAGTRMKSSKPKILHTLAGIPLVGHVLATARALEPAHVIAVVRHERDLVASTILELLPEVTIVDQDDIAGTAATVAPVARMSATTSVRYFSFCELSVPTSASCSRSGATEKT